MKATHRRGSPVLLVLVSLLSLACSEKGPRRAPPSGPTPDSFDVSFETSKGTFVWSKDDRISRFTDGSRTWIDGPHGLQVRGNNERFRWELGLP